MTAGVVDTRPQMSALARFRAELASEWTKTWSLRSTYWTLLGAVVAIVGLGALFCALFVVRHEFGEQFFEPWHRSLRGVHLAQIAVGVLGILAMTAEFASGMIRSTFAAVPQRGLVFAAKAVVFPAIVFVATAIASFAAFGIGQAILTRDNAGVSLTDPGILRAVLGVPLYLTVLSVFALALGTLIRHTAGAVAALFGILLVAPLLALALPSPWNSDVGRYLPGDAGLALTGLPMGSGAMLSPWTGFGVFCAWTAALVIAAGWHLQTHDI